MKSTNILKDSCEESKREFPFWKILPVAATILALLFSQKVDANPVVIRQNREKRAKSEAIQKAISESLKNDTISFESGYLRQQIDVELERILGNEFKMNLIKFYGEDVYKEKRNHMVNIISSNRSYYMILTKEAEAKEIWLWKYEWVVLNDSIKIITHPWRLWNLLRDEYWNYFSELNKKINQELEVFMKSKDMKDLEDYYWREELENRIKKIINEINKEPRKYWNYYDWFYSIVDVEWNLIKEGEMKELWGKYINENAAESSKSFSDFVWTILKIIACCWGLYLMFAISVSIGDK